MKKYLAAAGLLLLLISVQAQNVGIGESNPGAKLTVKTSDVFGKALLIKTSTDDTAYFIFAGRHYMNGYSGRNATLSLNNKLSLPYDNPQLEIMASGEKSGIESAGSLSIIDFANINSTKKFQFLGYLGNVATNNFSLNYLSPSGYKPMMYFDESGLTGFGTMQPGGKLQIDHRTSTSSPTLSLYDSSTTTGPIIQFKNAGSSTRTWQIRSYLNTSDYLDFALNGTIQMTISGAAGNVGIGRPSPNEKLDVAGNIKMAGKLMNSSTGSANLVPIAYGNISPAPAVNSGSGNFTVSKIGTGFFAITITGESYHFQTYTTVVTCSSGGAVICSTGSGGGNLYVYTFNILGAATDVSFCFTVYKQ